MSTTPRVPSALPGQPADFSSVLAHQPELAARFGALYAEFWQNGLVSQRVKEVVRLRNATITDCGL
jgi:hypothetical protein